MTTERMPPNGTPQVYAKCLSKRPRSWMYVLMGALVLGALAAIGPARAFGQDFKAVGDPAKSFFARHCQACHTGPKVRGDFRLNNLSLDFNDRANRERWLNVLEQVKSGTMPPKEKPRPPASEVTALSDWINVRVKDAAAKNAGQGRVVLRRLNRTEYENTVRDLLAVDLDLKELLAPDPLTNGFDNRAEALHVSSFLMEQYLEAAEAVLDAAIASKPRPTTIKRRFDIREEKSVRPKGSVYRHLDDGVAIFSSWASANIQVTLWNFRSRDPGRYRFRISGYGIQTTKPVTFHVMAGTLTEATQQHLVGYYELPANKPTVVEFVERLEVKNTIRIIADGLGVTPTVVEKVGADKYKGPGLNLQWVEIEGPLHDSWPPPSSSATSSGIGRSRRRPTTAAGWRSSRRSRWPTPSGRARLMAARFPKRTVTDEDVEPFLARVKAKLDAKDSFEKAMRVGLKSVLVSPHFLYFNEKPGKLDDFALASRLSYFLWSSMPDDELLTLAEQGKLNEPDTIRRQVERMLCATRKPRRSRRTSSANGSTFAPLTPPCPIPRSTQNTMRCSSWRWSRRRTCSSTRYSKTT